MWNILKPFPITGHVSFQWLILNINNYSLVIKQESMTFLTSQDWRNQTTNCLY